MDYEESLTIKAAWYYYVEKMTQQKISEHLGISRMRVIKLLEKARHTGVIQFKIREGNAGRMELEQRLIKDFGLKDAFVIPSPPDTQEINQSIAKAAAMYISDRLPENGTINIGYGETPSAILNNLATMTETTVSCVSLTGGVNCYLPNAQSNIFNAKLFLIPSPLLTSSKEVSAAIRKEEYVIEISRMARLSTLTVVGIGGMGDNATIIKSNILSKNDFMYLRMQGAVGDVLCHFIDANGQPVNADIENRLISTPLENLKELENVIGAAGGKDKVESIRAVLNGRYIDILITDENTAAGLFLGKA
ncbi:MAG: sugar-binding transcriptional regulator [Clostridiaceae bacterium]|nr:sugar-binding transcriptional regulator [Clostridiaceae bacterium]